MFDFCFAFESRVRTRLVFFHHFSLQKCRKKIGEITRSHWFVYNRDQINSYYHGPTHRKIEKIFALDPALAFKVFLAKSPTIFAPLMF